MKIASFNSFISLRSMLDLRLMSQIQRVLVEELNGITHHYAQQLSTRLGRSRYKEQFLFLYRDDVVDLIDCYQYKDDQVDDVDAFKREPYILYFKTHNTGQSLPLLKIMNVMILGDFRADGWYLSSKEREEIHIRSDKNSYWLIGDNVDTRAKTSDHHAYDRIVVYGEDMLAAIVPNSAKPFNFHKEVSDHYPVEVELLFPFGIFDYNPSDSPVLKIGLSLFTCTVSQLSYQALQSAFVQCC
uniref:Deoxyribonuclease 1 like 4, tandem duplicate 1 n=1 Tax=Maylandia zebra TaxID=106582 RepID=A0A3P9DBI9_9CICH